MGISLAKPFLHLLRLLPACPPSGGAARLALPPEHSECGASLLTESWGHPPLHCHFTDQALSLQHQRHRGQWSRERGPCSHSRNACRRQDKACLILPWRLRDLMKATTAAHLISRKGWSRRNQSWVYLASPAQHFRIRPWASLHYSVWTAFLTYSKDLPTHRRHCTRQEKHSRTWKAERWSIKTNCSGD